MGMVAIWGMHYIGNRAIVMDKGQPEVQIQYSPGYTTASFFIPTIVITIAFWIFSVTDNVNLPSTVGGGVLLGLAVCGMHYMGQGGISNYAPSYMWPYVVGSAVLAGVASTLALGLFFYFQGRWSNTWWKRILSAGLLAAAASGMHWTATVGTKYGIKPYPVPETAGLSRKAVVIVCICGVSPLSDPSMQLIDTQNPQSFTCCFALLAFLFFGELARKRSANRAQQLVLACAIFNEDGKLMVTPGGLLPCRKITDNYVERVNMFLMLRLRQDHRLI